MTTALLAVLAASLLGSLHCAGMCGPFLAFVVGAGPRVGPRAGEDAEAGAAQRAGNRASATRLQLAYHGARGAGYALLGAAAGAAGAFLDVAGRLAGLAPLAAGLAGATLVVLGLVTLARLAGWRGPTGGRLLAHVGLPARAAGLLRRVQARALRLPPTARALAIGATTTFLPCGWLYAFAVTAAGTGAPAKGLAVMTVFWVGTLPVLVSLGAAVRGATRRFGPRMQAVASLALVALGLVTLAGRLELEPLALARTVEARTVEARTVEGDERGVVLPTPGAPACCAAEEAPGAPHAGGTSGIR